MIQGSYQWGAGMRGRSWESVSLPARHLSFFCLKGMFLFSMLFFFPYETSQCTW